MQETTAVVTVATGAFEAPDRMTALALAGQLRIQGFDVWAGRPPLTTEGRIVRVVVPPDQLPRVATLAETLSADIKLVCSDEPAPGR